MELNLSINGKPYSVEAAEDKPLLWVLRDQLQLTGSKYGCGAAQCGACTVLVDGSPVRSCVTPASALVGQEIRTIEGASGPIAEALQNAWETLSVAQCGYCQSGQIMSAAALLESNPNPSDSDINAAMSGNICRCATYQRIKTAIHQAQATLAETPKAS